MTSHRSLAAGTRFVGALARCVVWMVCAAPGAASEPPMLTAQQLQADLVALESAISSTHPDIGHSVDRQALVRAIGDVKARLDRPMTRDEAWVTFTALNSVLADGHLSVSYPGGAAAEVRRHVSSGGLLFPFAVHVDQSGALYVRTKLNGDSTPLAGSRIGMLDGQPASEVVAKLLAHTNGDTPALRAALLSDRFAFWYWKFFGERRTHRLTIAGRDLALNGSGDLPLAYRDKTFEQLFRLDVFGEGAVLTIDEFHWRDKAAFHAFTRGAFARIRDAGVTTLIVDIRANSGGDDDMWIEGVMPYVASAPYRNGSSYVLKIIEGRQREGQQVGDVVQGTQRTVYPPQLDNPLRFKGRLYVLIGPRTYSSSVLFANVVQDHGFATVAGAGGAARSTQSGGTQHIVLPNTGMGVVVPRFVLRRPSGTAGLLQPDLLIVDDPLDPMAAVQTLLRRQGTAR